MNSIYIWKYENGKYFEGIEFIDKIAITRLPVDSFPIFNLTTEEVNGIAKYKAGDFDLRLLVDGGETSYYGHSIDYFFRGGIRNYKFLVGIQFGAKQFWGTSTNEYIKYNYINRVIEITCAAMETEVKLQISYSTVGLLDQDRTFDDFLVNVLLPQDVVRLNVTKAFQNYGDLIGDPNVMFKAQLERSMSIVGNTTVWDSFVELMVGTGLNYKVKYRGSNINFNDDYPLFSLHVFSLEQLTPCTTTPQIIEAEDVTLFRRLEWLFIKYRAMDISAYYPSVDLEVWDGVALNSDTVYDTDKLRPTDPQSPFAEWGAPCFLIADSVPGRISVIRTYPTISKLLFLEKDTRKIDLPLYSFKFPFEGYSPPFWPGHTQGRSAAFCRCLNGNNWNFNHVQNYAIRQYKRYASGFAKRAKRIKVIYDESSDFDLWKTIDLKEENEKLNYYISEISNIDLIKQECELLLIEF
jgi:hypothetical protein